MFDSELEQLTGQPDFPIDAQAVASAKLSGAKRALDRWLDDTESDEHTAYYWGLSLRLTVSAADALANC